MPVAQQHAWKNTILFQTAGLCLERSAPKSRCSGHVAGDLLGEDPEPREPWSLVAQGGILVDFGVGPGPALFRTSRLERMEELKLFEKYQ